MHITLYRHMIDAKIMLILMYNHYAIFTVEPNKTKIKNRILVQIINPVNLAYLYNFILEDTIRQMMYCIAHIVKNVYWYNPFVFDCWI